MRTVILAGLLILIASASTTGCGDGSRVTAEDLNSFAIRCAKQEMWAEAEFRLKNAIALQSDDARLYNNLAVALEAQTKLEEAYAEYRRAVSLAPGDEKFRRNLDDFVRDHRWELETEEE